MTPQEQEHVTPARAAAPAAARAAAPAQEFYLPTGGGTDPDFFIPADRGHGPGPFSRWVHRLPIVGRLRS
ncbi:hypothetical protein [Pseudarthrobacter sp. H2]|uniref:hypothetical protein n=1 Tax=Pseudarthrobacter sp. H2 TaxID=3418415 RepID=UPI003CE71D5C